MEKYFVILSSKRKSETGTQQLFDKRGLARASLAELDVLLAAKKDSFCT